MTVDMNRGHEAQRIEEEEQEKRTFAHIGEGLGVSRFSVKNERERGNHAKSAWSYWLGEVGEFLGDNNYPKLAAQLSHFRKKPHWLGDIIKEAREKGRNPQAYFWGVVRKTK